MGSDHRQLGVENTAGGGDRGVFWPQLQKEVDRRSLQGAKAQCG